MVSFLRRIREKLLQKGSFRKYMVYAIGEILLVMIGILLALQVNTWNQKRKDLNEEKEYLKRLRTDINRDFSELTRLNDRYTERRKNMQRFAHYFGQDSIEQDSFNIQYWSTHHSDDFLSHDDTYVDMINTGKLDLISDDAIKLKILELYSHYKKIDQFENHVERDNRELLYGLSIHLFDWEMAVNGTDKEAFLEEFNKVSSNLQVKNFFFLMNSISEGMTQLYEEGLIKIGELDALLEQHIN